MTSPKRRFAMSSVVLAAFALAGTTGLCAEDTSSVDGRTEAGGGEPWLQFHSTEKDLGKIVASRCVFVFPKGVEVGDTYFAMKDGYLFVANEMLYFTDRAGKLVLEHKLPSSRGQIYRGNDWFGYSDASAGWKATRLRVFHANGKETGNVAVPELCMAAVSQDGSRVFFLRTMDSDGYKLQGPIVADVRTGKVLKVHQLDFISMLPGQYIGPTKDGLLATDMHSSPGIIYFNPEGEIAWQSPLIRFRSYTPRQEAAGPQSEQLKALIARFEEAEHGDDKWRSMNKLFGLGTPEAFAYLCRFAEDPTQSVSNRIDAMILLGPLVAEESGRIRSTFLRLLDDPQPRVAEEAAAHLSRSPTADVIAGLQKRWPADRPPTWATMAGLRLIRHMDSPAVKEAFLERIESPGMSFTKHGVVDLSQWSEIPPGYRARLLGFIKSRPLDRRRLVWLAARSAAAAGSFDALDFLCDRLVVDWTLPSFDFGYVELQIMQGMLGKHRALAPSDEEAARARKIAGDAPTCPVLKNQGRLFVLLDRGHPAADGIFRITVIDANSHQVIKTIGTDGRLKKARPVPLKRLDGPHQPADKPVSESQESTPWPTRLEAFSYQYMPTAFGSKTDVGMDRSGHVSYGFSSAPHTGSGGQTTTKDWHISKKEAEQFLDSLVSTGVLDLGMVGAAKYPLHYFEFASKGWQKKSRPARLPDSIWKQMLPLMIHAHPEMWQENTEPEGPADAETAVPPKPVQNWRKKYPAFSAEGTKNLKAKAPVLVTGISPASFGFTTVSQQIDMVLRMKKHPSWRGRWTSEEEIWLKYRGEQLRAVDHLTVEHVQRDGDQIRVSCRRTISTAKERGAVPYLPVACVGLGKLPAGKYRVQWIVKTHHAGDEEHPDASAAATPASEKPETLQHSFTVEPAAEGTDVRPPPANWQAKDDPARGHGEGGFPAIGPPGFPVDILPGRLPVSEKRHVFAPATLFENWDGTLITKQGTARTDLRPKAGVLLHHYPHVIAAGHFRATGTFVCYIPDKDVFFLFGDCVMNHVEPLMGPYAGDPRKVFRDFIKRSEQVAPMQHSFTVEPAIEEVDPAAEEKTSATGALLDGLCKAFPVGENIAPDRFSGHPDLPALVRIAETDIDSLLAEGFGESVIVINPQSFEQFKKTTRISLRLPEDGSKANDVPTRADYEEYLASWREQDCRRRRVERRREIIWMIVKKVASTRRQVLVDLLHHKDLSIRWSTTECLLSSPSLKDEKVAGVLRSLARDKPRDIRPGEAMSPEQMWRQQISVLAALVLSSWQVKEGR